MITDTVVSSITKNEYSQVIEVWEASVRATHHFLTEEDIVYYKPLILNSYLDMVTLHSYRNSKNKIVGFMGTASGNLEMLFIHPKYIGQGIGKKLLQYAIVNLQVKKVDVNEDNQQAVDFYLHCGFKVVDRSELDGAGKAYPILHMELQKQ